MSMSLSDISCTSISDGIEDAARKDLLAKHLRSQEGKLSQLCAEIIYEV